MTIMKTVAAKVKFAAFSSVSSMRLLVAKSAVRWVPNWRFNLLQNIYSICFFVNLQVPADYVSKEVFDAINVYIIPKPHLQRCILTVNALDIKVVGYPVGIENQQKYARNAFLFNLCFVCDSWARSVQYEPVVKKLSEYLVKYTNLNSAFDIE